MKSTRRLFCCLFAIVAPICWCEAAEISPDPETQAEIDKVAVQLGRAATQKEGLVALKRMEASQTNKQALIQQVVLYLRFGAKTEERGYGAMGIMKKLEADKAEKIKAVLPLLDASDIETQKIAVDFLRSTDKDKTQVDGVDFAVYERILSETPAKPPVALIAYMYGRNPQAAVLSMSRIYGNKAVETELADKLKGDPKAALQSLADRSEWWARLYVAEMMKKQPQLRDAALLKKLEKDGHPLVKEKVAEITSGK